MTVRHSDISPEASPEDSGPTGSNSAQPGTYQQFLKQISSWPALAVGLIAGLILGLAIGWGFWPVQWVNAWPGDLNPEARAHYIAAVADAYAYYGDDRAIEIARLRLFDLNEDLGEEIAAAQSYFNDNPQRESRNYIVNMARLAQALNAESPNLILEGDVAPEAAASPTAVLSPSLIDWLNWLFVIVAAVILVVGGGYIIFDRNKRRRAKETDLIFDENDEDVGGFEEDEWDAEQDDAAVYRRPLAMPGNAPPEGDIYFEDDDLEEFEKDDYTGVQNPTQRGVKPPLAGNASPPSRRPDKLPELDYGDEPPAARPARAAVAPTTAVGASGRRAVRPKPDKAEAIAPAAKRAPEKDRVAKPISARPALPVLSEHTVHYLSGLLHYDETQNVIDDETGDVLADYGMGVNMLNGYLRDNPEQIIALDIFILDRTDEDRYVSQNRIIFSEYVANNNLEHTYSKTRPNDPDPIVAKPRTKFQLSTENFIMDCEILEVDYADVDEAHGVFQNVKIRLTVRAAM